MAYANRGKALLLWALGALGGCFESGVTPTSTTDPANTPCIPGETQMCLCVGGQDGVQVCNAEGTGYEPCECVGVSTGPSASATGTTAGMDDSTGAPTSTGVDTGGSSTAVMDSGDSDTMTLMPDMGLNMPGDPYGPCVDGCDPGEICIGGPMQPANVCAQLCTSDNDCLESSGGADIAPECQVVEGDGTLACVLPCMNMVVCPMGMVCDGGFCKWSA